MTLTVKPEERLGPPPAHHGGCEHTLTRSERMNELSFPQDPFFPLLTRALEAAHVMDTTFVKPRGTSLFSWKCRYPSACPLPGAPSRAHSIGTGESLADTREATASDLRLHVQQSLCRPQRQLVLMNGIKVLRGHSVS